MLKHAHACPHTHGLIAEDGFRMDWWCGALKLLKLFSVTEVQIARWCKRDISINCETDILDLSYQSDFGLLYNTSVIFTEQIFLYFDVHSY